MVGMVVMAAVFVAGAVLCAVTGFQLRRGRWLRRVAGFTFLTDGQLANPLRRAVGRKVGTVMFATVGVLVLGCLMPVGELADRPELVNAGVALTLVGTVAVVAMTLVLLVRSNVVDLCDERPLPGDAPCDASEHPGTPRT